jgi:hypothetical protein
VGNDGMHGQDRARLGCHGYHFQSWVTVLSCTETRLCVLWITPGQIQSMRLMAESVAHTSHIVRGCKKRLRNLERSLRTSCWDVAAFERATCRERGKAQHCIGTLRVKRTLQHTALTNRRTTVLLGRATPSTVDDLCGRKHGIVALERACVPLKARIPAQPRVAPSSLSTTSADSTALIEFLLPTPGLLCHLAGSPQ